MSYIIGVSSGWWSIARGEELLGLASKIGSTATYGVNFVQVDFESIAEFQEPDVVKNIKRLIDTLQVDWGMHGEIGEMMALESALEVVWKYSHRRLHQYLDTIYVKFCVEGDYREYIPRYIVFHASNLPTIAMIVERFRYAGQLTVTPNGNLNWIEFIQNDEGLKNWAEKSKLIYYLIAKEGGVIFTSIEKIKDVIVEWVLTQNKQTSEEYQKKIREKIEELIKSGVSKEEAQRIAIEEARNEAESKVDHYAWDYFRNITKVRFAEGAISYEDIAYLIVARYLYEKRNDANEPLWKLFFKDKSWEELENSLGIKFWDEKGEVKLPPQIVALVAARYILGHFTEKNKEEFLIEQKRILEKAFPIERINEMVEEFLGKSPFEKLSILNNIISKKVGRDKRKLMIIFENPEIMRAGEEGLQRLIHAIDIYRLVKAAEKIANGIYLGMVFDSEHYLHNNLDPLSEIKSLQNEAEDAGKFLIVYHVGAPKPYHPAHLPIDIGSEAQYWIYKYAFELRKVGFGKYNDGIFIFERGGARGGQYPAQFVGQSAAALRIIVNFLEKDVAPDNLPPEFYGISSSEILSEERQLSIIKEHFFDPLKGLLYVPEEEYTFLGAKAIERGKRPDEWKKEELR